MPEMTSLQDKRGLLCVAHPGHELRVFGWLERSRPHVFVLTDGSGSSERSRMASTARVLQDAGAVPGTIFGRLSDSAGYAAMLDHDFELFAGIARELASQIVELRADYVVGDAAEGYNPMHDACRLIVNAAVAMASRRSGRPVRNFAFPLVGHPDQPANGNGVIRVELDEATHARKLSAARSYPELASEVQAAFDGFGTDAFRVESLRPVSPAAVRYLLAEDPPFYESYGERQVHVGRYSRVLRYRTHALPLADALQSLAGADGR